MSGALLLGAAAGAVLGGLHLAGLWLSVRIATGARCGRLVHGLLAVARFGALAAGFMMLRSRGAGTMLAALVTLTAATGLVSWRIGRGAAVAAFPRERTPDAPPA